jgi:toxin-antitoxin system PIN domain toxin
VIAVDTNILVYCHRADSQWHERAVEVITGLAEGSSDWAVPWPCIWEFLAITTHPRIYNPPTPLADAVAEVERWTESPTLQLIGEGGTFESIRIPLLKSAVRGPAVHDARIAAICQAHGIQKLWTADRDFSRFPGLRTENPLLGQP